MQEWYLSVHAALVTDEPLDAAKVKEFFNGIKVTEGDPDGCRVGPCQPDGEGQYYNGVTMDWEVMMYAEHGEEQVIDRVCSAIEDAFKAGVSIGGVPTKLHHVERD